MFVYFDTTMSGDRFSTIILRTSNSLMIDPIGT